jgi:hypothetical protein
MTQPEQEARNKIDELLRAAGWVVSNVDAANITAHRGVAIREFPLKSGHGFADYLLLWTQVLEYFDTYLIVRTFRDKQFTEIFPGREWVLKTLVFVKGGRARRVFIW